MTHPFHPWLGREFELLTVLNNWGEDRVMFIGPDGQSQSIPLSWTDVGSGDPFVVLANGRSLFRPSDLLALRHLIDALAGKVDGGV